MKSYQKKMWLLLLAVCISGGLFSQDYMYRDLTGRDAGNAENALWQKGYTHIKSFESGRNIVSYWWNNKTKSCICERVSNGEVKSIVKSMPFDCNKSTTNAVRHIDHYKHSLSDHNNYKHYTNDGLEAAFELGYVDGIHHKVYSCPYTYEQKSKTDAYEKGYIAGDAKRRHNTSHHTGSGGYAKTDFVDWKDLEHKDASDSYQKLKNRGFREIHSSNYNNALHKYFHNKATGQCIEVEQRGRITYRIQHYAGCNQYLD